MSLSPAQLPDENALLAAPLYANIGESLCNCAFNHFEYTTWQGRGTCRSRLPCQLPLPPFDTSSAENVSPGPRLTKRGLALARSFQALGWSFHETPTEVYRLYCLDPPSKDQAEFSQSEKDGEEGPGEENRADTFNGHCFQGTVETYLNEDIQKTSTPQRSYAIIPSLKHEVANKTGNSDLDRMLSQGMHEVALLRARQPVAKMSGGSSSPRRYARLACLTDGETTVGALVRNVPTTNSSDAPRFVSVIKQNETRISLVGTFARYAVIHPLSGVFMLSSIEPSKLGWPVELSEEHGAILSSWSEKGDEDSTFRLRLSTQSMWLNGARPLVSSQEQPDQAMTGTDPHRDPIQSVFAADNFSVWEAAHVVDDAAMGQLTASGSWPWNEAGEESQNLDGMIQP